jgi:ParE toxin of type II toxin-antitoxin system, parDE
VAADGTSIGTPVYDRSSWDARYWSCSRPVIRNPYPPEVFRWGEVLRLRVGPYRIMYTVEGDLITILRVDRRAG